MHKINSLAENICKGVIFLNNKKNKEIKNNQKVENVISERFAKSDPNGSYTGFPMDPCEKPVQDADDL